MSAAPAAARPAMSYSIWATSLPATTSRSTTIQARPGLPAADVALLALRPGAAARRPDRAGGAQGRRSPPPSSRRRRTRSRRVAAAGLLPAGARVAEYGSPHGGSWLGLLAGPGPAAVDGTASGRRHPRLLRHDARGRPGGGARRACRPAGAGRDPAAAVPLARHDRPAAASGTRCGTVTTPTTPPPRSSAMLACRRPAARARRGTSTSTAAPSCSPPAATPMTARRPTTRCGRCSRRAAHRSVTTRSAAAACSATSTAKAGALHDWLAAARGTRGGPSSATVPRRGPSRCCCKAEIDRDLLPAVADASPAKRGLRMPGTRSP